MRLNKQMEKIQIPGAEEFQISYADMPTSTQCILTPYSLSMGYPILWTSFQSVQHEKVCEKSC